MYITTAIIAVMVCSMVFAAVQIPSPINNNQLTVEQFFSTQQGDKPQNTNVVMSVNANKNKKAYIKNKFGIGVKKPEYSVDVSEKTTFSDVVVVDQKVGVGLLDPQASFDVKWNMDVQGNMKVDQKVGVGTTPSANLHVKGTVRFDGLRDTTDPAFKEMTYTPTGLGTRQAPWLTKGDGNAYAPAGSTVNIGGGGWVTVNVNGVILVEDPTQSDHVANKQYIDGKIKEIQAYTDSVIADIDGKIKDLDAKIKELEQKKKEKEEQKTAKQAELQQLQQVCSTCVAGSCPAR